MKLVLGAAMSMMSRALEFPVESKERHVYELQAHKLSAGCCYEIHIMYHAKETDILTANASLYIVGDWTTANGHCSFFERKLLLNGSVMECLEKAVEEEKEIKND